MKCGKGKCHCQTTIVEGHRLIDYMCPLHKSAPDLLQALGLIIELLDDREGVPDVVTDMAIHRVAKRVIAKAESNKQQGGLDDDKYQEAQQRGTPTPARE